MRAIRNILLFVVIPFLLLMTHSVFFGHTDCFVIVPFAEVFADAKPVQGWLHREIKGRQYVVTRISASRVRESDLITFGGRATTWPCADRLPSRSPIFMLGDVNHPCFQLDIILDDDPKPPPVPLQPKPRTGPHFVEFTATDGARIRATW